MKTDIDATNPTDTIMMAAVEASKAMGGDLLKMSCFYSNWPQRSKEQSHAQD